jgi:hypothetical protein
MKCLSPDRQYLSRDSSHVVLTSKKKSINYCYTRQGDIFQGHHEEGIGYFMGILPTLAFLSSSSLSDATEDATSPGIMSLQIDIRGV